MIINCDIGERGAWHAVDHQLMNHIGMANIACGGHAGDAESIGAFTETARQKGVRVAAHLSYPDRDNFGRTSLALPLRELHDALDWQLDLSLEKSRVKPHGALYNDCNVKVELAAGVADWLHRRGVREVVTPADSALARESRRRGLQVLAEAFAERRYASEERTGQLVLVSRSRPYASISELEEAVEHSRRIIFDRQVNVVLERPDGTLATVSRPIEAQTLCIHSDSEIALALAERLAGLVRGPGR